MSDLAIRTQLDRARTALAEVQTVQEAVNVKRFAESVRYAAEQAHAGMDAQNEAAEIRLRAERRAGQMLDSLNLKARSHDATHLSDVGVSKSQSSRFQQVAEIPEPVFEEYIASKKDGGEEITTAQLISAARSQTKSDPAKKVATMLDGAPRWMSLSPPERRYLSGTTDGTRITRSPKPIHHLHTSAFEGAGWCLKMAFARGELDGDRIRMLRDFLDGIEAADGDGEEAT